MRVPLAGRLLDGSEFDSSYARGQPTTFAPNQVIKGWTEAMQLMVVGDKWEMYIPYQLAYGAGGKPPKIPAAATLIFVMEIVKIKGETVPKKITFPDWTAEQLSLWLEKDQAACVKWREGKAAKWEGGDEKLKATYPTREELDTWLEATCIASRDKALWKRTHTKKKPPAAAAAAATPAALTKETGRALLTSAMAALSSVENKAKMTALLKECESAPPESAGMMKMMKLMPAVQEILKPTVEAAGYKADDLMTLMMQVQSLGTQDPSIAADVAKVMAAVTQGDLSGF